MDSRARSIAKAVTYRILGLVVTLGIAWAVTRRVEAAALIGLADTLVKIGAYYFHERMWNRARFGRGKAPEYQI